MLLMTSHHTFLRWGEDGAIIQCVYRDDLAKDLIRVDPNDSVIVGPRGDIIIDLALNGAVTLSKNGIFYCAEPNVELVEASRAVVGLWETFYTVLDKSASATSWFNVSIRPWTHNGEVVA